MKLIKLTNSKTENTIYINEKHLISFTEEKGIGSFVASNDDFVGYVKETPLEILCMLIANEKKPMDTLEEMWEKERMKEAEERRLLKEIGLL